MGQLLWRNSAIYRVAGCRDAYYFIADLHALTTVRDPERLRGFVRDAAIDLVALGLDPERATLFVQSDVPEVAELTWLLMTVAPMGLLERCHAYKDKKARGLTADAGLFTYPVLMAADILAYDADVVPVGEDQVQHIEVCRDLAGTFNHLYGDDIFRLPKPRLVDGAAKVPGTDGQKMSKSYENTIEVFENSASTEKENHANYDGLPSRWRSRRIHSKTICISCFPLSDPKRKLWKWENSIDVVDSGMAR